MIQWLCIIILAVIAVVSPMLEASWCPEYHDSIIEIMLALALVGWINATWNNRRMIKQRLVLYVFLGYTVWIIATNQLTELTTVVWRYENLVFLACVVAALLIGGLPRVRS